METITFHCKTVTPLVMNGAYGNNDPELRPPGIKASLRFWWRALNGHLLLTQLKEQEAAIFGSTKGRSKVIIRVTENIPNQLNEKTYLLPHKTESERAKSPVAAFISELSFNIRIDFDRSAITPEKMKNLFILVCTLGGWGKRSRRGFGSVMVTGLEVNNSKIENFKMPETLDDIFQYIDKAYFEKANNTIYSNFRRNEPYPFVKSIQIGETIFLNKEEMLEHIVGASHEVKEEEYNRAEKRAIEENDFRSAYNRKSQRTEQVPNSKRYSNFESAIGDGANRFASPIYVSTLNDKVIVTTLNSVPKGRFGRDHEDLQAKFKNDIL